MSSAKDLFDSGELDAAIEELTREVRAHPTDATQRTFLFELLCFAGNWERAERQLDVLGEQSAQAEVGVQLYRNNIQGERERRRLFSEGIQPHFLSEPPAYVDRLVAAITRIREGKLAEARQMLDRAEEERPALSGRFNGKPFQDFRDADDRVGPVLELTVKDHYTWLPFEQIRRLELAAPKRLRDLLWAPAIIETADGTVGEVHVPALYEGTSEHPSNQVRLGRMTDWRPLGEGLHPAVGLRLFLVGAEETPLFEARAVEFDPPATAPPSAEGQAAEGAD